MVHAVKMALIGSLVVTLFSNNLFSQDTITEHLIPGNTYKVVTKHAVVANTGGIERFQAVNDSIPATPCNHILNNDDKTEIGFIEAYRSLKRSKTAPNKLVAILDNKVSGGKQENKCLLATNNY